MLMPSSKTTKKLISRMSFACFLCYVVISDKKYANNKSIATKTVVNIDTSAGQAPVCTAEARKDTSLLHKPLPPVITRKPLLRPVSATDIGASGKKEAVPTVSTQHQVENLFDQGYSVKDIARELSLDKKKVKSIKKQLRKEERSLRRKRKQEYKRK